MKRLLILAGLCAGVSALAEPLKVPQPSPAASVSQTVGVTVISVNYHRPAVGGRPVWGALVPWGETWRMGANENTTVSFSTDVKVAGKALKAGTYGLHAIPTKKEWTIAFSNMAAAWGSFTYDAKEDALRITVTPKPSPFLERLAYRFDDPTETKSTLVMSWEKLSVPMEIEVDTPAMTMASIREQLRGLAGFDAGDLAQAAEYWLQHNGPVEEGLGFADKSVKARPMYGNQMVRAGFLEKQGDAAGAAEQRTKALEKATEPELNNYAYGLLAAKKNDEALKLFQLVVTRFPDSWNAHDSLGEALLAKGDKAGANAEYAKALAMVKDPVQKKRIEGVLARLGSSS
jgi:hypothetical protein